MSYDDPEGLAELARRRYGMDLSEPDAVDEEPPTAPAIEREPEPQAEPEAEPEAESEPEPETAAARDAEVPADSEPGAEPEPDAPAEPEPGAEPEADEADDEADEADDEADEADDEADEADDEADAHLEVVAGEVIVAAGPDADDAATEPDVEVFEGPDPHLLREHAIDLRLARLHLRTGAIQLARAELEALAVLQALEPDAYLDLAETRWRGGDLASAGDAVVEYLENGGTDALAYVIAAEASAAMGRIGDARRLARRALDRLTVPLERVFAGQPRSEVWPSATDAEVQPVSTLFSGAPPLPARGGRIGLSGAPVEFTGHARPLESVLASGQMDPWESASGPGSGEGSPYEALPLGLDLDRVETPRPAPAPAGAPTDFDPAAELELAGAAIAAGDLDRAGVLLSLVLRVRPALAPAVLDVARGVEGPAFDLVRGDALRLTGHEAAAQEAFAAAVRAVEEPPPAPADDGQIGLFETPGAEPESAPDTPASGALAGQYDEAEIRAADEPLAFELPTEPSPWDPPTLVSPVPDPEEPGPDPAAAAEGDGDGSDSAGGDIGPGAPESATPDATDDAIDAAARGWPSRARIHRAEDPPRRHRPAPVRRAPAVRPPHHRHHDDPRAEQELTDD